jgi:hypothetical protein
MCLNPRVSIGIVLSVFVELGVLAGELVNPARRAPLDHGVPPALSTARAVYRAGHSPVRASCPMKLVRGARRPTGELILLRRGDRPMVVELIP